MRPIDSHFIEVGEEIAVRSSCSKVTTDVPDRKLFREWTWRLLIALYNLQHEGMVLRSTFSQFEIL